MIASSWQRTGPCYIPPACSSIYLFSDLPRLEVWDVGTWIRTRRVEYLQSLCLNDMEHALLALPVLHQGNTDKRECDRNDHSTKPKSYLQDLVVGRAVLREQCMVEEYKPRLAACFCADR